MFLANKISEFIGLKVKKISKYIWISPLLSSLLSLFIMSFPFEDKGMRIDLRAVPLFYTAYLGGWKFGLIAIILPTIYRFYLGGSTTFEGITQGILLPSLIGFLFHKKASFNPPYTIIHLKHMITAFLVLHCIRSVLMLWTTPVTYQTVATRIFFETIGLLSIAVMQNDAKRNILLRKELEFQARHDAMTNLYNLRYFRKKVEEMIKQKKTFVIAMFDVDYFKNYNDTHGHLAGDAVLRTIGKLLSDSMREEDIFARYGGEEFIICFNNVINVQKAISVGERIRTKIESYKFYGEETQPSGKITISIGISGCADGKTLDTLIKEADTALYLAKRAGRNRTEAKL
ncbi:GGDEF domain-containing protein [Bacillus salipaludis]|nr:GGDEF domain-containing protein [Bacillus salipaludis]